MAYANITGLLVFHAFLCRVLPMLPLIGIVVTSWVLVVALKLTSYYQYNLEVWDIVTRIREIKNNENYRDLFGTHEVDD